MARGEREWASAPFVWKTFGPGTVDNNDKANTACRRSHKVLDGCLGDIVASISCLLACQMSYEQSKGARASSFIQAGDNACKV